MFVKLQQILYQSDGHESKNLHTLSQMIYEYNMNNV